MVRYMIFYILVCSAWIYPIQCESNSVDLVMSAPTGSYLSGPAPFVTKFLTTFTLSLCNNV